MDEEEESLLVVGHGGELSCLLDCCLVVGISKLFLVGRIFGFRECSLRECIGCSLHLLEGVCWNMDLGCELREGSQMPRVAGSELDHGKWYCIVTNLLFFVVPYAFASRSPRSNLNTIGSVYVLLTVSNTYVSRQYSQVQVLVLEA